MEKLLPVIKVYGFDKGKVDEFTSLIKVMNGIFVSCDVCREEGIARMAYFTRAELDLMSGLVER